MLRTFTQSDIGPVLAIEEKVHIAPWNEETFKTCFQQGYKGWVLEVENKIVGFIIVSITYDECHILNICVNHEYQRQGYGKLLMEHMQDHAKTAGIAVIYLEVRRSNSRAIRLYEKMNFHLIGERKNYYPTVSGHEDALILAKKIR